MEAAQGVNAMTDDRPETDLYSVLSNDELYEILCDLLPHMHRFPVSDLTRQTVIAMLKITDLVHFT
jgi:hypothetical protein